MSSSQTQAPPVNGATPPPAGPNRALADLRGVGKMTAATAAKERGGNTVAAFFEQNKAAIAAVLPKHMTPERMMKIALRCLRTTPKLMNCTLDSLFGAVVTASQMGLEPNTPQGHLYLIPFENRRKNITEVQVIPGYKGLIDLARRSGEIVSLSARVRCAKDTWAMEWGTEEGIKHQPAEGERGEVIGFYAVAKLRDGGTQFEYMSVPEVNRIRDESQGYKAALAVAKKYGGPPKHPWVDHWEQMALKTTIRRLCKYLPMSIELASAVELDGAAEGGKAQGLAGVLEGVEYTVQPEDAPTDDGLYDPDTGEVAGGTGAGSTTTGPAQIPQDQPGPTLDLGQPETREKAPAGRGRSGAEG